MTQEKEKREIATTTNASPLRLVHHHPGRIRTRADVFHGPGCDSVVTTVRAAMHGIAGIVKITHTERTGSILIEYEPGVTEPDMILSRIVKAAELSGVVTDMGDKDHRAELVGVMVDGVKILNNVVHELTGGRADLREIVPVALAVTSAVSFVVNGKDRLPRWDNALWWSHSVFLEWHRRQIARASQTLSDTPEPAVT